MTFDEVEDALLLWLKQARTYETPKGRPLLKQKANELAAELGHECFHHSDGWLDRFIKRGEITFGNISGEANSVPKDTVDEWLGNKLPSLLQEGDAKEISVADETELLF